MHDSGAAAPVAPAAPLAPPAAGGVTSTEKSQFAEGATLLPLVVPEPVAVTTTVERPSHGPVALALAVAARIRTTATNVAAAKVTPQVRRLFLCWKRVWTRWAT